MQALVITGYIEGHLGLTPGRGADCLERDLSLIISLISQTLVL